MCGMIFSYAAAGFLSQPRLCPPCLWVICIGKLRWLPRYVSQCWAKMLQVASFVSLRSIEAGQYDLPAVSEGEIWYCTVALVSMLSVLH